MKQNFIQKMIAAGLLLLSGMQAFAQEPVNPQGKAIVTVFGDAGIGFSDSQMSSLGFNLDRAYLGYQYTVNEHWKAKVVYDMGKGDDAALQRLGYVKNAEIDYANGNLEVKLGLTSTALFNTQEKFWGYRYAYKSFMDQRKWGSSADLGLWARYSLTDWLSADLSVFNGEGYKKIQADDQLLYGLGITATPVKGLTLRAYTDFKTAKGASPQENIALFAGYKCKTFRIGAEYNMQLSHGNGSGHDVQGISVYGAYRISPSMELYARYDNGRSTADDGWAYSQDGQTGILGLHCHINNALEISPCFRVSQKASNTPVETYACLSAKIAL